MEEDGSIVDLSRKKLSKVPESILSRDKDLIEELYLDSNNIELLSKGVFHLSNLRILSTSDNNVCKLPSLIGNLVCLQKLDVSKNCISGFPDNISKCTELCQVDASVNPIVKLPEGLVRLSKLTHLILNETFLENLPEDFGRLSKLKVLEIRHNHLQTLPKSMHNLKELERLDIGDNKFVNLPVAIGYLANLQELLADCNVIEEIPPVIGLLRNLTFLELSKNKLECLPPEIDALTNLTDLHLSVNELLEIPENIGSLKSLQTLKLDENDLIFLPNSIGRLENLEELDVTANNLEGLPTSIGILKKLRILTLDNNCIKSIPDELGNCTSLSLLSLHSNEIISMPESIGYLDNLQMINISANMLASLPVTFLQLKHLRALWLSENQSKSVVPLEKKYDEKAKKFVVTCVLLPQELCDLDQIEEQEKVDQPSSAQEKEEPTDCKEMVRTRGSISQSLISGNDQSKNDAENEQKPWYEQEFIEGTDGDLEIFLADREEMKEKELSVNNNHDINERRGNFESRYTSQEEQPYYLTELESMLSSSLKISCDQPMTSLQNTGIEEDIYSFYKGPPSPLLSSRLTSSAVATQTGVVGLSLGLGNHIDSQLLADTSASIGNDNVYGNTSAISTSPPVFQRDINNSTDQSCTLSAVHEESIMRLRFTNKRNRNGNPLCQYEAFKPTRFNLYQDSNDVSWDEALNKDTLDTSSPMIKKKSVTAKDNPTIGERLARDESPQRVGHQYRAIQKYEEKIRALQQQRLKERSRRKNNSARVENYGEQRDNVFPSVSDTLSPTFDRNDDLIKATSPQRVPRYYIISDDDDSVAIKLGDFALASPLPKNENTQNSFAHLPENNEALPPVDDKRYNDLAEQQNTASYYNNNQNTRSASPENDSILHASLLSCSAVVSANSTSQDIKERYQADDIKTNDVHMRDISQSYSKHGQSQQDSPTYFEQRNPAQSLPENYGNYSNHLKPKGRNQGRFESEQEKSTQGEISPDNSLRGVRKHQLSPNSAVRYVTVKSSETERPLSPRLIMASDERNSTQDVTYKEFKPDCTVADVTSFLISNLNDNTPLSHDHDKTSPTSTRQIVHEQVPVDCDVDEVARNISRHLVDFCKVDETPLPRERRVRVTDLDMPDAASLLSKNAQYRKLDGNAKSFPPKSYQIITIPEGPKEEIQLRVYRSPNLGFTIGGGVENETAGTEGIYVVAVKPDGPSYHLLKLGDRILEVNKLNLRDASHEHAVLFLTHNQQLDLLIERPLEE